jgi:hypothetical protein
MQTESGTRRAAEAPDDLDAITRACADYIEGWYTGDAERMRRCLHPELVKRRVFEEPAGVWQVRGIGASAMVAATMRGEGTVTPEAERVRQITVFDVFRNTACAKVLSQPYVDYLHLARVGEGWMIVNVLWARRHE